MREPHTPLDTPLFDPLLYSLNQRLSDALLDSSNTPAVDALLNGAVAEYVQRVVPAALRREFGLYLTPSAMAADLVRPYRERLVNGCRVQDPTCGAGDLLLAAADHLPLNTSISSTLTDWSQLIGGSDISPALRSAARTRLTMLAARRHGGLIPVTSCAPEHLCAIQVTDVLDDPRRADSDLVLLNPPYTQIIAPVRARRWAKGRVSAAAVVFADSVDAAAPGTTIAAILPESLRSGVRYEKWRTYVSALAKIESIETVGQFDTEVDIDVFILRMRKAADLSTGLPSWLPHSKWSGGRVADFFEVRVGTVVPHRDREGPTLTPYLTGRACAGKVLTSETLPERGFGPRTFSPPFVALHRTSSPSDKQRLITFMVVGSRPVSVENHLLVLRPMDGARRTCERLIAEFQQASAAVEINNIIRCRHLTASAVASLPLRGTHFGGCSDDHPSAANEGRAIQQLDVGGPNGTKYLAL